MNKKIVRSSDAYLLSFLIPVLSMIVIFFARGIFPFGRESFLRTDMYHQYAPFFSEFQYKLRHGGSLLYSWNVGLGVNFSALYSYYLASPVNFLILLVPKNLVIEFMTYLIVLKIGLSGLSAAFYFRKHYHRTNFGCCFFGILYAMSGYVAAYSWNIMWLDCILLFPLILLGMERMLSGGSPVLYTLTLGLSILSNYYISIMICLFLFLSFLSYLILDGREGMPFLLRRAGRFFLYSLIAGGLAAVTLLPEIYALKGTASGDINFPETAKQYFGIIDMFARHMPLVETEQGLDHWPNLYSGTVTFLLLPMYFLNGKISLRKKLASGLLLLFFYLSFSINILNFIWHGLHYPNSLPCRQSFLYIFMLLCLCYEAYLKRKATGLRELGISLASALSFIILCQKVVTDDAFHWAVFYTAILFVLLYYLLFYLEKKGGLNYNALLLSALVLLGMECAINMAATSVTTTSRTSYTADNADTIRLVRAARAEDKSFCRFEKMTRKTKDDGAFLNFPSVSIFSSTAYKECSDFFRKIGCEASTNAYSITGSTPLVNMLFSVKYDIYSEEPAAAEKRGLSYRDGSGEMLLYQNEYSLPPGLFLREEELTNWHTDMGTPALVQNSFCDAMQSSPVLIPVIGNFQEKDYSFTADTAGEYYVYVTNPKLKQVKAKLASGEKSFENVDRGYFLELGYLSEGEEVRLSADTAGQSMDCEAYRFDFTALKELYRKLSGRSWEPKLHTDTKLSGSATPSEDSTLLLFVPYDEGWSARVDGRKVKPVKALNCFLGIPLDAGVHEITLSYFPKGLFLGILSSILSLCLFLLLFFLSRKSWREGKWKRREKRYRGGPDFIALTSERADISEEDELPEEDEFSEGDELLEENELPEEGELPAGGGEVMEEKEDSPSFSEEREPEERGVFSDFEDLEDCEELEEYEDPEDCEDLPGEKEPEEEEAEAEEPEDFPLPTMEEERAAKGRAAAPESRQSPEGGGSEPGEKTSRNPREGRAEKKRGRNPRRNEAEAEEMELEDLFTEDLSELPESAKSEGEEERMKLWGGRFRGKTDELVERFNASLPFDRRLYREDIEGSVAHARMLGKQGILSEKDAESIIRGLYGILSDIEGGRLVIEGDSEDIHSFIEAELTKRIGEAGKRLHTGRSRNDQVALDMKLCTREELDRMKEELAELIGVLTELMERHRESYMPGFTHLQKAQPTTLAHHLGAYREMFRRDRSRLSDCRNRLNESPLGAGAFAGTSYPLDREMTASELGFDRASENSMDSVSDRDYLLEYLFDLSLIAMHLSRLSEELILWNSNEYRFLRLSDAYSTGSSIMPQKKNPDIAELIRGKCGRVYGDLFALLTVMKGLPLAYNKDMQEDKEAAFDAMDTVRDSVRLMSGMLKTIEWDTERMRESAKRGFSNATDVADYLVGKGIPFRTAHGIVGELVLYCEGKGCSLDELSLPEFKAICPEIEDDIYGEISLESCVKKRRTKGAPGAL